MDIRIEPLDTLFFRDGKPFTMGEDTWADSSLLPSPSVIYGALRTAVATQNEIAFTDLPEMLKGNVIIKNIHYRIDGKVVLPLPLDLVEYEKDLNITIAESDAKEYEVKTLVLKPNKSIFSTSKNTVKYFWVGNNWEQVKNMDNGLILTTEFDKYLAGDLERTNAFKLTDFILNETKIGIGRDDSTKTSDEGSLFRTDMKRGKDFDIGVNFELNNYSELSSLVRLGGEGKIVNLSVSRRPVKIATTKIDFKSKYFKIYFATPCISINGEPNLSELKLDFKARLVTACVGKPVNIGGFDMEKRQAKPMYKTIPAGSVFYYEADTDDVSALNDKQGISLSDEMPEQGFGIAYFGTWTI